MSMINNNDRMIVVMTAAAIVILLTAFLASQSTAIAARSGDQMQCDVILCAPILSRITSIAHQCQANTKLGCADLGATSSSNNLSEKQPQQHPPLAHTQTAPQPPPPLAHTQRAPSNPDNGKGSGNRRDGNTALMVPMATSASNVYLVWSSNKTGNWEISLRASSDNGNTFGQKINLSNDTSDSTDPQISASGSNVYVTWWNTIDKKSGVREPIMKVSNDNGKTFGDRIMLSAK